MHPTDRSAFAAAVVVALALAACAQTAVQPGYETSAAGLPRPDRILVYDFAVSPGQVRENEGIFHRATGGPPEEKGAREQAIGQEAAHRLASDLVAGIRELGLPAERANRQTVIPPTALLITGEFLDVDEGNRLRRVVIGFGAGQSKVDTAVRVLAPSGTTYRTLLDFRTHADSGTMPGAAATMGAGAAAQGGVTGGMVGATTAMGGAKTYRSTLEALAARTAEHTVAHLSEFFARQGWIRPPANRGPQ
jgi:hypothetical protein